MEKLIVITIRTWRLKDTSKEYELEYREISPEEEKEMFARNKEHNKLIKSGKVSREVFPGINLNRMQPENRLQWAKYFLDDAIATLKDVERGINICPLPAAQELVDAYTKIYEEIKESTKALEKSKKTVRKSRS